MMYFFLLYCGSLIYSIYWLLPTPGLSALEEQKCLQSRSRDGGNEPRSHLKESSRGTEGASKETRCISDEGRESEVLQEDLGQLSTLGSMHDGA